MSNDRLKATVKFGKPDAAARQRWEESVQREIEGRIPGNALLDVIVRMRREAEIRKQPPLDHTNVTAVNCLLFWASELEAALATQGDQSKLPGGESK